MEKNTESEAIVAPPPPTRTQPRPPLPLTYARLYIGPCQHGQQLPATKFYLNHYLWCELGDGVCPHCGATKHHASFPTAFSHLLCGACASRATANGVCGRCWGPAGGGSVDHDAAADKRCERGNLHMKQVECRLRDDH